MWTDDQRVEAIVGQSIVIGMDQLSVLPSTVFARFFRLSSIA